MTETSLADDQMPRILAEIPEATNNYWEPKGYTAADIFVLDTHRDLLRKKAK